VAPFALWNYVMDGDAAARRLISALFSMGCFSPINEFVASVAGRTGNELSPSKLQASLNFSAQGTGHPKKPFCSADLTQGLFSPLALAAAVRWNRS
jgi:hypothetical protein